LPVGVALTIAQQVADGVHTLHLSNTVHRDLKPANIFVSHNDGEIRAKILDLGAVKVLDKHGLTSEGSTIGTVSYMAPEQTYGERIGFYTDVYAMGLMLFEMLAGVHPAEANGMRATKSDWIAWQRHQTAPDLKALRPELPDMLVRLVHQSLRKEGSERAPSGGRLAIELRAIEDVLRKQGRLGPTTLERWSDDGPHEERVATPDEPTKPAGGVDRRLPYASTQETAGPYPPPVRARPTSEASPVKAPESESAYDTTPDPLAAVLTAHGEPPQIKAALPEPNRNVARESSASLFGVSPTAGAVTEWRQVGPAPAHLKPQGKRRPFTARWDPARPGEQVRETPATPPGVELVSASPPALPVLEKPAGSTSQFGSRLFLLFGVLLGLGAVLIGGALVWWTRAHAAGDVTPPITPALSAPEQPSTIPPAVAAQSVPAPSSSVATPSSAAARPPLPAPPKASGALAQPSHPSPAHSVQPVHDEPREPAPLAPTTKPPDAGLYFLWKGPD